MRYLTLGQYRVIKLRQLFVFEHMQEILASEKKYSTLLSIIFLLELLI